MSGWSNSQHPQNPENKTVLRGGLSKFGSTEFTESSTIDGVTLYVFPAVSLNDDEVIGKAKLSRDTLLEQARAIHPKHKELLLSAFVDFLRLCFSLNDNISSAVLEELAVRAIDCSSWGFNTYGALQRIRDFQLQRQNCNRKKQFYDDEVVKLEKHIAETLAKLEELKASQRAMKDQGASISYVKVPSLEFEGAFLEHHEELPLEAEQGSPDKGVPSDCKVEE